MSMHSLRSDNLRNEAPNICDGINTYECQRIVVEAARMAVMTPMLFV